jgi:hypothetical protein
VVEESRRLEAHLHGLDNPGGYMAPSLQCGMQNSCVDMVDYT